MPPAELADIYLGYSPGRAAASVGTGLADSHDRLSAVPTRHPSPHAAEAGFSLLEVIVAVAVLATGLVAVAQMFAVSTNTNRSARWASIGTALAQQKIEQIRGLAWGFDAAGLPQNDFTSNLTVCAARLRGGAGAFGVAAARR